MQEVEEAFRFWGTPEGDLVHPADCMHELFEKMRRHRVNIDGNVSTVMFTTLVLEVSLNPLSFPQTTEKAVNLWILLSYESG